MAQQIKFFEKNQADIEFSGVGITVTDTVATNNGQDIVDYVRNRKNTSGWITTESTDAANTTLEVELGDEFAIDTIMLVGMNWKAFTVKYWNVSAWVDFPTAIAETANDSETKIYSFASVQARKIQIIIMGAFVVDDDKWLKQLIITETLGQFTYWPVIKKPVHSTAKRKVKALSGKGKITEGVGAFSCSLNVSNWNNDADLGLVEDLYFYRQGFLVLLSGGDEDQFATKRKGYRNQDVYLMRPSNDYTPEYVKGLYETGVKIKIDLVETVS